MTETFDAVVVGAGPNGLVAANLLADAGWSVVVLEATEHPGGAVRSAADHPAPGFTADLFSAFYPLAAASPVVGGMRLEEHGLRWVHAPAVLAHVLDDGRGGAALPRPRRDRGQRRGRSGRATATRGGAGCPGGARSSSPVLDALLHPFPPVRPALSMARRLGVARALRLARTSVLPARRFVGEEFRGQGAALLVAGNAMHTDLSPEAAGSALYGLLLAMLGQEHGFPVPEGGSGRLTDALVDRLRSPRRRAAVHRAGDLGGARRHRGRGGRCSPPGSGSGPGVPCSPTYPPRTSTARWSAPATCPPGCARTWTGSSGTTRRSRSTGRRPSRSPGATGRCPGAGTVHLGGGLDDLTRCGADLATSTVPERPFVLLGQMTTTDPTRSPARHRVRLGLRPPAERRRVGRGGRRLRPPDRGRGRAARARLPRRRDRHAACRARPTSRPPTRRWTAARSTAARQHCTSSSCFRPTPGLGRADTPFPGLFLAGSSAHPGGGVHGACGANAARAALLRNRVGARVYDASVGAAQRYLG